MKADISMELIAGGENGCLVKKGKKKFYRLKMQKISDEILPTES